MSSDYIVISSDNESEFNPEDSVHTLFEKVSKHKFKNEETGNLCELLIVNSSFRNQSLCKEFVFISSSEDDEVVFKPKMKSDSEDLPKIHFKTREARRHRQKHRERRRSNEKKHDTDDKGLKNVLPCHSSYADTYMPSDEPPRIPPLPDLSLFCADLQTEDSNSQPMQKGHTVHKEEKTPRARKRRQTIEEIKSKEREIRGALFAVDSESFDINYFIARTKKKRGDLVNSSTEKRLKDERGNLLMKKHSHSERQEKNVKIATLKTDVNGNSEVKENKLKRKILQNSLEVLNYKNSPSVSLDWKNESKEKKVPLKKTERDGKGEGNNKTERNDVRIEDNSNAVCTMSEHKEKSKSQNKEGVVNVSSKKPNVPVHKFDRKVTDKSDTCHQIGSRVSSFDLLASLGKRYKRELKKLKISPTSKQAVKTGLIPVVNIGQSEVQSVVSNEHSDVQIVVNNGHSGVKPVMQKSKSVESSESESDSEKSKRHFMDVFSDISEAETDDGVEIKEAVNDGVSEIGKTTKPLHESFFGKIAETSKNDSTWIYQTYEGALNNYESDEMVLNQDLNQRNVLPPGVISENVNSMSFNMASSMTSFDKCSGSSYKNYQVKVEGFSDISEDDESQKQAEDEITVNNLSEMEMEVSAQDDGNSTLKASDSDESVIYIASDTDEKMPSLRNEVIDKDSKSQAFEMPILEKFSEVYSNFRNELDDQDMLPDISDDESKMKINSESSVQAVDFFTPKTTAENSSQRSKGSNLNDNIFKKFSFTPAESSLTLSSKSVSSFLPVSSGTSKFSLNACSLTSSHSDVALTSPKECSTPKSRKRKMRKSQTCSNFSSVEFSRSYATAGSSSHYELMSLTKQMDQLTIYVKDFVKLNEDETALPDIPESRKSIVYGCEEDGVLNLAHALNFVEHFSRKNIIPSDLCSDIIKAAFYSECKLSHIHWAYNLLSELNTRRCAEIEITWEMIEQCLKVTLSAGQKKPYNELLQSTLLLQLGVDVLKMDLFTRELSDNRQIRKTYAYKMFAYDVSTSNRKRLIYYLNQALHAGQCRTGTNGETFQLPEVLPMLQDILALCVDVSSSCVDCANMLATDMVTTYKFLPNLVDKQLLLKSTSSHLLQCKLVQHVLESQYDCYQVLGGAFPDSLEDIIQCFFKVRPLKNPLTPPTTPNEDNFWEDEANVYRFADEVTEEIAILLYFVVVSYLQASNDKLYIALRLRVNLPERKKRLRSEDVEELARMKEHVEELEEHLRGMTPDLTENTEHYLFLMRCLGDLGEVQE